MGAAGAPSWRARILLDAAPAFHGADIAVDARAFAE